MDSGLGWVRVKTCQGGSGGALCTSRKLRMEDLMVTSRDVARVAGVSQTTVSRVLTGSALVSEKTRKRVEHSLVETGYAPNAAARAMRTHRVGTIGVVVSQITNPFYSQLIGILGKRLIARGLLMTVWDGGIPGEAGAVDAIRQGLVDGLIFTTATKESRALREALLREAPLVLFNRVVEELDCDQVSSDNRRSGEEVANFLLARGHRRIGYVAGPSDASTSVERLAGLLAALDGSPSGELIVHEGDYSDVHGRKALAEWFADGVSEAPPTAVFCANDMIAVGLLDEAKRLGIRVPEDLSVVGHDDIELASWSVFDLTSVRQPVDDMVEAACDLLLSRIQAPGSPSRFLRFRSQIIERGSTARSS